MNKQILYLGDTTLDTAASYLAGIIHHCGWTFEYIPSDRTVDASHFAPRPQLLILSDYPAARMAVETHELILRCVADGMGLLMIGGWESYHGLGGDWNDTPVGRLLPVTMQDRDDRVNCDQPALVWPVRGHEILFDLPWQTRTPTIGGFNQFQASPTGFTLLQVERFHVTQGNLDDDRDPEKERLHFQFKSVATDPLLVVGICGAGRTAALATDVAPHWVGGLVDWGEGRVAAQAPGAEAIEVGVHYVQLFRQLLAWTGQL